MKGTMKNKRGMFTFHSSDLKTILEYFIVVLGFLCVLWMGMLIERKRVDNKYPMIVINYTP